MLTDPQMCVDGGVAGGARQVLVLAVGDVLVCASIAILLSKAKVDNVDQVALFAQSHQEIIRLHISVNEVLGVNVLNATDLEENRVIRSRHRVNEGVPAAYSPHM